MFIDLGNAMINNDSIEGVWKRDMPTVNGKTPKKPYKIEITLKGTDRKEEIYFMTAGARDSMYNIIRGKIMKGE